MMLPQDDPARFAAKVASLGITSRTLGPPQSLEDFGILGQQPIQVWYISLDDGPFDRLADRHDDIFAIEPFAPADQVRPVDEPVQSGDHELSVFGMKSPRSAQLGKSPPHLFPELLVRRNPVEL